MPHTALIVIDMLNAYDHPDAKPLTACVRERLPQIVELRDRAATSDDALLVYVNDNTPRFDAYLRGYEVVVPPDAVAHIHGDLADAALRMMKTNMHTDLTEAGEALQRTS